MNARPHFRPAPQPSSSNQAIALAASFWLVTYAILSIRSELRFDGTGALLNSHRALGTFIGASALWLVLVNFDKLIARFARNPYLIVGTVFPASLVVLAVMMVADVILPNQALPLNRDIRWVIAWAGYFGAAVSLYLAYHAYTKMRATAAATRATRAASALARLRAPANDMVAVAPTPVDTWEWMIDALADEMAAMPDADRHMLIAWLTEKARYPLADDSLSPGHNARVELIERIASRLP